MSKSKREALSKSKREVSWLGFLYFFLLNPFKVVPLINLELKLQLRAQHAASCKFSTMKKRFWFIFQEVDWGKRETKGIITEF